MSFSSDKSASSARTGAPPTYSHAVLEAAMSSPSSVRSEKELNFARQLASLRMGGIEPTIRIFADQAKKIHRGSKDEATKAGAADCMRRANELWLNKKGDVDRSFGEAQAAFSLKRHNLVKYYCSTDHGRVFAKQAEFESRGYETSYDPGTNFGHHGWVAAMPVVEEYRPSEKSSDTKLPYGSEKGSGNQHFYNGESNSSRAAGSPDPRTFDERFAAVAQKHEHDLKNLQRVFGSLSERGSSLLHDIPGSELKNEQKALKATVKTSKSYEKECDKLSDNAKAARLRQTDENPYYGPEFVL